MYVPLLALAIALLIGAALPSDAAAVPGTLTVVIEGQGRVTGPGVDCTSTCSVFANAGRPLKAIERPGSGYSFASWEGCRAGTGGGSPDCFVDSYAPVVPVIVRFRDTQAPGVALVEPTAGPPRRGVVNLAATASDNAGVARVDFRVRGATAGSDGAFPFGMSFDTTRVPDGLAAVEAVAFDAAGNAATQERGLTIDNTAPALAVSGPSNRSFAPGTELSWTLSAGDATGITSVQCGVVAPMAMPSFGACAGGAASHSARIDTPGSYAFFARVTDAAGNVTASRPLEFKIEAAATSEPALASPATSGANAFLPIVRHSYLHGRRPDALPGAERRQPPARQPRRAVLPWPWLRVRAQAVSRARREDRATGGAEGPGAATRRAARGPRRRAGGRRQDRAVHGAPREAPAQERGLQTRGRPPARSLRLTRCVLSRKFGGTAADAGSCLPVHGIREHAGCT